jgi:uncharacterized membrane protein YjjP (DUF1212 family)
MNEHQLHNQKVLDLIMLAGEILLHNGAEIFRVQETMEHIAMAYQVNSIHIYTLSNGIFVTMHENDFNRSTEIKHIPLSMIHIGRITAVNQLSRDITLGKYTIDEASTRLHEIEKLSTFSKPLQTLAASIGCACFSFMFGGSIYDALVAFVAGLFLYLFHLHKSTQNLSKVLKTIIESMIVSSIAFILYSLGFGDSIDKIIIGSIIPLVPGAVLTTSIRDYFNGDYLSGTIHLTDAIMTASCIAIGVGATFQLFQYWGIG